ncbi:stressosome-associated protein Prli42 [Paenibacillus farraposensis]|uniref:Stressosome-associated protein Prli42 n=1 Tax=Paenibacillus farraposensis TaxID=2807095 RepID=A0ABW4DCQ6_9BACL|nr:stressosome-associated protein Prli42 [Paenibacillus farraposensis]MCC3379216.1 stressosome-associated protein Prli42 [Paenibacillus farraposensis]
MSNKKWIRFFVYVMLAAMVGSTVFMVIEPFIMPL